MSNSFRTAVEKNVSRPRRHEAIDSLVRAREATNLAVLVRTGGLHGTFRRHALEGLAECDATDALEELAGDTSIEPSLRRRAEALR